MEDYKTFSEYELEKEDTILLITRLVYKPAFLVEKWTGSLMKISYCSENTVKDIKTEIERRESEYGRGK